MNSSVTILSHKSLIRVRSQTNRLCLSTISRCLCLLMITAATAMTPETAARNRASVWLSKPGVWWRLLWTQTVSSRFQQGDIKLTNFQTACCMCKHVKYISNNSGLIPLECLCKRGTAQQHAVPMQISRMQHLMSVDMPANLHNQAKEHKLLH